ncbi:hypothetical protein AVEN_108716-1 [Araneus ventricosus]|uniref:Uncharacterized protein n=1 Tax=Araneus ventricosus TaxID=182803 RepID=A0A4Y2JK08_ARAVE|nr:hypothetical protein AVEN_108716-1 [Araneus ventricosus]
MLFISEDLLPDLKSSRTYFIPKRMNTDEICLFDARFLRSNYPMQVYILPSFRQRCEGELRATFCNFLQCICCCTPTKLKYRNPKTNSSPEEEILWCEIRGISWSWK